MTQIHNMTEFPGLFIRLKVASKPSALNTDEMNHQQMEVGNNIPFDSDWTEA
jgi:hypothetical protein